MPRTPILVVVMLTVRFDRTTLFTYADVSSKGPIPNLNPSWRPASLGPNDQPKASDIMTAIANNQLPNPLVTINKENGLVYVFSSREQHFPASAYDFTGSSLDVI
jgi:hypothetical protein